MTICLTTGAVCSDDKTVHFSYFTFLWFLLITWCWINTFKRCYHCGLQSTLSLSDSIAFRLTYSLKNARALAPQIHTVYNSTQLSMVPFWFSNLHKKTTVHIMFNILVSAFFCFTMIQSALRIFSFFSLREWNWQMIKCIFMANAQKHTCTSATGIWVKKYI